MIQSINQTGVLINTVNASVRIASPAASAVPEGGSFASALARSEQTSMDDIFERAAKTYGVSTDLLKAVAKVESNFSPTAVSPCGARGVMQLMPGTAEYLGVTDSFDPEQNIMGGAKYLAQMLDMFSGDIKLALAAYNAGAGNVSKYGGIPPFTETQNYVSQVLNYMGQGGLTAGSYSTTPAHNLSLSASAYDYKDYQQFSDKWDEELGSMLLSVMLERMTNSEDDSNKHKIPL